MGPITPHLKIPICESKAPDPSETGCAVEGGWVCVCTFERGLLKNLHGVQLVVVGGGHLPHQEDLRRYKDTP